jgi:hypothetical protein
MIGLLKMCLKVLSRSSRNQLLVPLGVALVFVLAGNTGFVLIYGFLSLVLVNQATALRIKERRERWYDFLLAVGALDWKYPSFLYLFAILLATVSLLLGWGATVIGTSLHLFSSPAPGFVTLAGVTASILLYVEFQLLAAECVDFEKVLVFQKVALLGVVVLVGALLKTDLSAFTVYVPYLLGTVSLFALAGVFPVAGILFRRKCRTGL